jgi:alkanesulfonate monooxygenase SsuD/methylene tetrahydromethanopterin reductase-like flavin-dependent oxidoreductase (luciferase family)
MEDLVIYGTPEQVAAKIQALREQVGPFGELVYAGLEWVDPTLARRSMELMAKEVMPLLESV